MGRTKSRLPLAAVERLKDHKIVEDKRIYRRPVAKKEVREQLREAA